MEKDFKFHSVDEVIAYIREFGFLPLFKNDIPGFSVDDHINPKDWWCGDSSRDPWIWREEIVKVDGIFYGKFFHGKAGFISKEWLPYFANYRRNGYDFDALWDDEKASRRQKKLMDLFTEKTTELYSFEMKKMAGFGKDGEKNFDGTLGELQYMLYLCIKDFRQKKNKAGKEYGWKVNVFTKPETIAGYDCVTQAYNETPATSRQRIVDQLLKFDKNLTEDQIFKVI